MTCASNIYRLLLCLLCLVASNTATALPSEGSPQGDQFLSPYLVNLHLHGPLSEGSASMGHHTAEGERLGFDALWWADHMERQFGFLYRNHVDFEGSLSELFWGGLGINEFSIDEDIPDFLQVGFDSENPASGSYYAQCRVQAAPGSNWTEGQLDYFCPSAWERKSLLADPVVKIQIRPVELIGEASFRIRLTLSARSDGSSPRGIPNILEYLPEGMEAPPPPENVQRVTLPVLQPKEWNRLEIHPAEEARTRFWEGDDQSLFHVELVFSARDSGVVEVDLDDFGIELHGPTDLQLFWEQKRVLEERYSENLVHHVGMEVAGPQDQEIQEYSSRDHLVALFPDSIPALFDYIRPPSNPPDGYPGSGVLNIQEQGGLAIIAHFFGVSADTTSDENALYLARRIITDRAWNAEAIEVGYLFRGRPLDDHITVWDKMSANEIYITGVAPSDNHSVVPWDVYQHHWASWLRATDNDAPSLIQAVRGGEVFFGDPLIFDPHGDLIFEASNGTFSMGDVVPASPDSQGFHAVIQGARAGDDLVVSHNGFEIDRSHFDGQELDYYFTLFIEPGDFVRLEVRDGDNEPYLFSNPIYFVDLGTLPPEDRAPGI